MTLGPMPADALREMVRTGALLQTDQVRAGDDDEWCLASEIPDLTEVFTVTSNESIRIRCLALGIHESAAPF